MAPQCGGHWNHRSIKWGFSGGSEAYGVRFGLSVEADRKHKLKHKIRYYGAQLSSSNKNTY